MTIPRPAHPESQRIAIAEACGWTKGTCSGFVWVAKEDRYYESRTQSAEDLLLASTPDYLNDLNACHEMEKALTREQHSVYIRHLENIVSRVVGAELWSWALLHATAPQRCEAFLRCVGKRDYTK